MKYGYARVSTDGQSVEAQVKQLTKAGCKKIFREVASGAKTDHAQQFHHRQWPPGGVHIWIALAMGRPAMTQMR
jgi:hypothetical protein